MIGSYVPLITFFLYRISLARRDNPVAYFNAFAACPAWVSGGEVRWSKEDTRRGGGKIELDPEWMAISSVMALIIYDNDVLLASFYYSAIVNSDG